MDREAARLRPGKRYPALLNIHGGPFTQYGTGFFDESQVYAGGGYVVLFSNPRGGSGYSEEHGRAIRGPVGDAGPGWGRGTTRTCSRSSTRRSRSSTSSIPNGSA